MTGLEMIAAERKRQIKEKGYSLEHDRKENPAGELALAAMCYACPPQEKKSGPLAFFSGPGQPSMWPWKRWDWKPGTDRKTALAKAGAMIAAEIDRLQAEES